MARLLEIMHKQAADYAAPGALDKVRHWALNLGLVGVVVSVLGLILADRQTFFQGYLFAFLFWMNLTIACLSLTMLQHLSGGNWGMILRRLFEAGTRVLPFMAVAVVPVLVGAPYLYWWAQKGGEPEEGYKYTHYLTLPGVITKTVFFVATWLIIAYFLNKWSLQQDANPNRDWRRPFQRLSGGGIVWLCISYSLFIIDYAMSIEHHWYSTMYGFLFLTGGALGMFALSNIFLGYVWKRAPFSEFMKPVYFHDTGKLMLAFVLFFAYISFSQYLIIWSANLPEEITWYMARTSGGWEYFSLFVVMIHFVVPFALLLSRDLKRRPERLVPVAVMLFIARFCELYLLVMPSFGRNHGHFMIHWVDISLWLGFGGLWVWAVLTQYRKNPVLPLGQNEVERLYAAAGHGH